MAHRLLICSDTVHEWLWQSDEVHGRRWDNGGVQMDGWSLLAAYVQTKRSIITDGWLLHWCVPFVKQACVFWRPWKNLNLALNLIAQTSVEFYFTISKNGEGLWSSSFWIRIRLDWPACTELLLISKSNVGRLFLYSMRTSTVVKRLMNLSLTMGDLYVGSYTIIGTLHPHLWRSCSCSNTKHTKKRKDGDHMHRKNYSLLRRSIWLVVAIMSPA